MTTHIEKLCIVCERLLSKHTVVQLDRCYKELPLTMIRNVNEGKEVE